MKNTTLTINALSERIGTDRRTLKKHLKDIPPDEVSGGSKRYRLETVLAALNEKQPSGKRHLRQLDNLLRTIAETAVLSSGWRIGTIHTRILVELGQQHGLDAVTAKKLALQSWFVMADLQGDYIRGDQFNTECNLDELWRVVGFLDASQPPEGVEISVPPDVKKLHREIFGTELPDALTGSLTDEEPGAV